MNHYQIAQRCAMISFAGNVILAVIKILVGIISNSSALLSDGLNSVGDIFSSVITLIGNRISEKPSDEDHPTGHGKAEYIFSALIGLSLLIVAFHAAQRAASIFLNPTPIQHLFFVWMVCIATIVIKASLFIYSNAQGKKTRNPMVLALAEDHRSDIFVTVGTLLGTTGSYFGIHWLDPVAGIIIASIIARSGIQILIRSYRVLMDTTASYSSPIVTSTQNLISSMPEVQTIDSIVARPVGTRFFLEIKIGVDGNMTVLQSHAIGSAIKNKLLENNDIADVLIHINPV